MSKAHYGIDKNPRRALGSGGFSKAWKKSFQGSELLPFVFPMAGKIR